VLGKVEWIADIDRTDKYGLRTTITADQPGENFPATGRFEFYARLTIEAEPEAVYISQVPVVMTATLTEWPHNRALYTSQGPVVYEKVGNREQTVMTPQMTAQVTAQVAAPDLR
jgi:hypothetical protein